MFKYILVLIFVCSCCLSFSQTGWDYLNKNDLFNARTKFQEDLNKDSLNESSLLGSMLIAEITEDQMEFKKSARRLMFAKKDDGNYHSLFSDYASYKNKEILENKNLTITAKLPYLIEDAENDLYVRKFSNSQKIYNDHISHLNWSFIGPFTNINGY